ncbi:hypothetical protein FGG08_001684 [Glutinoglossum americanum]|uniref:Protein sym1 n=1 Tax=Glutinoglossum americanum TaxID=1670608 RepID=A0A9P8L632_9PEZI|nr:hypothetical protein FGG08_001684 [Glutinoglossum americanum]
MQTSQVAVAVLTMMVTNSVGSPTYTVSYQYSLYLDNAHRWMVSQMLTVSFAKVLAGIADTVAQLITIIQQRAARKLGGPQKDDFIAIEIHDLDKKNPLPLGEHTLALRDLPPPFNFERLARFMAYGFLMAPVQFKWFQALSRAFPLVKGSRTVSTLQRVACDQLIFAPIYLACFFAFMTVAEGGGRRAVARKFQDAYLPALKANFILWPIVQVINFRVIPIQFQLVSPHLNI